MVTLAIIGILSLIASPSLLYLYLKNKIDTQTNQIINALYFTRNEAIKLSEIITFCPSANHQYCENNWEQGQIIKDSKKILRIYPALSAGETLSWRANLGNNNKLQFTANGFTNGQNGSFIYCTKDKKYGKRIIVEQSGRIRIDPDFIAEDHCR